MDQNFKANILRKEFLELDLNPDDFLSKEELFSHLDRKMNGRFDRDVGNQLYEKMDKDYDSRVTIDEFINVFLEAEALLHSKISQLRLLIEDQVRQRNETLLKFQEIEKTEILNTYGICQNSQLIVMAGEVRGLREAVPDGYESFYLVFEVAGESIKSEIRYVGDQRLSFSHSFPIHTGFEELQVSLLSLQQSTDSESQIGHLTISLNRLTDQSKKEESFTLFDPSGSLTDIKLSMSIQWIFSKSKFLRELIEKFDSNIKYYENDIVDYENDLAQLYAPFKGMVGMYRKEEVKTSIIALEPVGHDKQVVERKPIKSFFNNPKNLLRLSFVIISLYTLLSILVCWDRSCFLDLCLVFLFVAFSYLKLLKISTLRFFAGAVLFSFILDFPWLVIYSENWWNLTSDGSENADEQDLKRYIIVISYFLVVCKILVAITLHILGVKYEIVRETALVIVPNK